ncbi:MAG: NAD(P)-dependent oxidoreductase [Alphaproteobacteria bacterium]|nr:NAD(P)-dependent oxidoreductase [Alphaproteobacteria bacterium]
MRFARVAILSPGDMGNAVGAAIRAQGRSIHTCLAGRGAGTIARAARTGFVAHADLGAMLGAVDLVLAILLPEAAYDTAERIAAAMVASGHRPLYADMNAVSPETARRIAAVISNAGGGFVNGGIVGAAPGRFALATRFYVSGPEAEALRALHDDRLDIRPLGPDIARASAVKMCYAAVTKATTTLHIAALMAGERLGVSDILRDELAYSQPEAFQRMKTSIPFVPADAGRWIGEMREIAETFESVGVTTGFHVGAREVYEVLARTPYAAETRETLDRSRTLEQSIATFVAHLPHRKAAAE